MRNKLAILISGLFLFMLLMGLYILPSSQAPKVRELEVVKVDDVWKVVDATDYTKTEVRVKKKDTIVWNLNGTDASFQFPIGLFNPVSNEDDLQNGYTKFVKDGKKLKLKIKDDALTGTFEYAVFCIADGVFATGDSPPKIIIE
jgi:hypothetical protein